ncbi:hypothetical protein [Aeromonas veronii]|uniref:hypothetical protein n=1 Tax=Aeromonas veronii TaxID=654 RepID=UPI003D1B3173
MADNKEFAEQIASAMVTHGADETLIFIGPAIRWVSAERDHPIKYGVVTIEPKQQPLQS